VDARSRVTSGLDFAFPSALRTTASPFLSSVTPTRSIPCRNRPPTAIDRHGSIDPARSVVPGPRAADFQNGVVSALASLESVLSRSDRLIAAGDESLTIVYRILFLLFAESRQLVPTRHPVYGGASAWRPLPRRLGPGRATGIWERSRQSPGSRMGCRATT
jgi:hypothetical protein